MTERERGADLVVPEEVLTLLEERAKVQSWMTKLQELEGEASPEVYQRVLADYRERLQDVGNRLSEHREELEGSVAEHGGRVKELREERDRKKAELEEARLRYRVGEFSEKEWNRRREEGERGIQEMEARLADEEGALAELERVLEELVAGRPAPVEAGVGVGEEAGAGAPATGEARERPGEGAALAPEEEGEEEGEEKEYLDELEFLESLSLEETERFDAVSRMLDEEEGEEEGPAREGEEPR